MIKKLLFCLFYCASFLMQAQEPVSVNLSEKDGAPDKEFYNIIEDSKGFIWLCADKGFYRYDGKTFKNYSNDEKRGLSVFGVKEDTKGRIWCNNITGQFFYVANNKLHTFIDLKDELKGELADFEVKDNNLLVFTQHRIYKIDLSSKKIDYVLDISDFYGSPYLDNNTIYFDKIIIHFDNTISLFKIDESNQIKEFLKVNLHFRDNNKFTVSGKSKIIKVDDAFLLKQKRNNKNVFFLFSDAQKSLIRIKDFKLLESKTIQHLFTNSNEIWICTSSGIWVYELVSNSFKFKKQILKDRNISKVIKDKDDNYWVTTLNNGIYVIPNIHIEQYTISDKNKNITSLDKIDENNLVFGTTNGDVGFYNIKSNTEKVIDIPIESRVSALTYNAKKKVSYIGLDAGGFMLNHKTLKVDSVKTFNSAKSFSILNNDELLIINYRTVRTFHQDSFNSHKTISNSRRPYSSYFYKKKQSTFIGYVDDVVRYDSLWQPKTIRYKSQSIYGLTIDETNDKTIWVGTFKNGVFGIKNDSVVYHLNTKNGLVSNRIEKIKADKNNLWIATDSGIQEYNTTTNSYRALTKRDGIVSYDISGIAVFDDKVVFSSKEGLFAIDKAKAFRQTKPPEVYFNKVEVNENELAVKANYTLEYDQNSIKIGFNVNGFQFNQKGKYSYRLLGLNSNWITNEADDNAVKYNSLPSGKYTFEVKPVIDVQAIESKVKAISFAIKKPFWKTWWFIAGCALLIFGSIVLYFRKKIKQKELERENQVKQLSLDNELIALKLENLRSQMNPHFIFNALNSIQEYIVLNQKKLASDYLGKFADLIRTYLTHSTKGSITLQEEMDCLEMYLELEKLRFEDKLDCTITVSGDLSANSILIPTMLVQPYVENALKHGLLHRKDNRNLKISFFINEDAKLVKCSIVDNGVGRDKAEEYRARSYKNHKSFATKATEDRLNLLNYGKEKQVAVTIIDLFENEMPTGTQVNINIPFTID